MNEVHTAQVRTHFDSIASARDRFRKRNSYYYKYLETFYKFLIPKGKNILEVGSGTGDLLASLLPKQGVGVDISSKMVEIARKKFKKIQFIQNDAHSLKLQQKFDFVVLSDLIGNLEDIQKAFEELHKVSREDTRIIITYYNFLWEPLLVLAEKLGFKTPQPTQNWLTAKDIENLLNLASLEIVKKGMMFLVPVYIPFLSDFVNKYIARLPLIKHLCLTQYFVVRPQQTNWQGKEYSVSVIIPARNEAGNIEEAVIRTPKLGKTTELIFIEGNSKDNTLEEIRRVANKYHLVKKIKVLKQGKGIGKGDAVRKGFASASGEVLMILDADLTMPPEDLPKYYHALRTGKGEFIMGSRLIYPMQAQAMRLLNIFGNKFFSLTFSFLLDQPIKDTLCGTKVLFKKDYQKISDNRKYFGDFDPFGDFDLIFGASKLNLKILEIPIRYKARTYGETNISRFRHGWLLLKMVAFASRKIKFV